jgi:hypothetical protein
VYKALTPTHWEDESLLQIKLSIGAWQDHFSSKGEKKHSLCNPTNESSRNVMGNSNRDTGL